MLRTNENRVIRSQCEEIAFDLSDEVEFRSCHLQSQIFWVGIISTLIEKGRSGKCRCDKLVVGKGREGCNELWCYARCRLWRQRGRSVLGGESSLGEVSNYLVFCLGHEEAMGDFILVGFFSMGWIQYTK